MTKEKKFIKLIFKNNEAIVIRSQTHITHTYTQI